MPVQHLGKFVLSGWNDLRLERAGVGSDQRILDVLCWRLEPTGQHKLQVFISHQCRRYHSPCAKMTKVQISYRKELLLLEGTVEAGPTISGGITYGCGAILKEESGKTTIAILGGNRQSQAFQLECTYTGKGLVVYINHGQNLTGMGRSQKWPRLLVILNLWPFTYE